MKSIKTTVKKIYQKQGLQEACNYLAENGYSVESEESLKSMCINLLEDSIPDYNFVSHIVNGLQQSSDSGYYWYDVSMGTLEEITPINNIEDLLESVLVDED